MPTYTIRDKKTGDIFEMWLSPSQYVNHMAVNPHLERYFDSAPGFNMDGKSIKEGTAPLGGFKEVLQKIGENHPNSPLNDKVRATPRDTKTVKSDIAVGKALKKRNEATKKKK